MFNYEYFFSENLTVYEVMWKTQNLLLLCHNNNGYANAPQCYISLKLPILSLLSRI